MTYGSSGGRVLNQWPVPLVCLGGSIEGRAGQSFSGPAWEARRTHGRGRLRNGRIKVERLSRHQVRRNRVRILVGAFAPVLYVAIHRGGDVAVRFHSVYGEGRWPFFFRGMRSSGSSTHRDGWDWKSNRYLESQIVTREKEEVDRLLAMVQQG